METTGITVLKILETSHRGIVYYQDNIFHVALIDSFQLKVVAAIYIFWIMAAQDKGFKIHGSKDGTIFFLKVITLA